MESTHAGESWFSWVDYTTFSALVVVSCAGGFWYGMLGTRTNALLDVRDYLLGGRTLATFPVALSLISSVTVLGTSAEVYNYGAQYWLIVFAILLSGLVVSTVYLPVFCTLRLSSSYEYLELRFNRHVRAVASLLFMFDEVLFLSMIVYVPSLAFYRMTGVNVHIVGAVMVVICGLYTVLGGLRAVVWTDALQIGIMFLGVAVVAIVGTYQVGGVTQVLQYASEGGRLELWNWDPNPYVRQTAWGSLVGGFFYWTAFNSVNQTIVQRYMSLPTKKQAVIAVAMFCIGSAGAVSLCVWCGLVAWGSWMEGGCSPAGTPPVSDGILPAHVMHIAHKAGFYGMSGVFLAGVFGAGLSSLSAVLNACSLVAVEDGARGWARLNLQPRTEGLLARGVAAVLSVTALAMLLVVEKLGVSDGILPAHVMHIAHKAGFYGMSGVFLAGVFGAGLSSLSAVLNACSLVAVEDGARGWARLNLQPRTEGLLARGVAAVLSVTALAMLLVVEKLGGILSVAISLSAIAASATCGVFTLGMLIPWAGSRGAIIGAAAGGLLACTVALGSQAATAKGLVQPPLPPSSECAFNASFVQITQIMNPELVFPLFRLSYHWIAPLGLLTTVLVGAVWSALMDNNAIEGMDPELLSPVIYKFLPKKVFDNVGIARRRRRLRETDEASSLDMYNIVGEAQLLGNSSQKTAPKVNPP